MIFMEKLVFFKRIKYKEFETRIFVFLFGQVQNDQQAGTDDDWWWGTPCLHSFSWLPNGMPLCLHYCHKALPLKKILKKNQQQKYPAFFRVESLTRAFIISLHH